MSDQRSPQVRRQAEEHAERAQQKMEERRAKTTDGVAGWITQRAGEWSTDGPDETVMQRQKFLWNTLVDHYFRMEMDGWDNVPDTPVLLVGIHSGAPFVWDAWTVGVQWWRP
jgi:hypothetical protein